jgi:hypothetical protein
LICNTVPGYHPAMKRNEYQSTNLAGNGSCS